MNRSGSSPWTNESSGVRRGAQTARQRPIRRLAIGVIPANHEPGTPPTTLQAPAKRNGASLAADPTLTSVWFPPKREA